LGLLVWPSRQASRKSAGFAEASGESGSGRVGQLKHNRRVGQLKHNNRRDYALKASEIRHTGVEPAEYTDYLCPFCERYFSHTMPALLEIYVRTGQVKFVVHDFPLASLHPTAPTS
jgi:hypothetical protein